MKDNGAFVFNNQSPTYITRSSKNSIDLFIGPVEFNDPNKYKFEVIDVPLLNEQQVNYHKSIRLELKMKTQQ